jgi:hypothetical protein
VTSIDKYFNKRFNSRTYNCAHFVCDVWADLKGFEMAEVLKGFLCAEKDRKAIKKDLNVINFLPKPVSPCVVLMQRPKAAPHVGIYLENKVLHILEASVQYQPLDVATLGFNKIRFFVV